ncbi:MAG: hypothetical protein ACI4IX_05230 [Acutalibacteraceae bacterium]
MTSKKSSVNPFRFTFLRNCSKNWLVPFAVLFISTYEFLFCGGVNAVISYFDTKKYNPMDLADFAENRKFIFAADDPGDIGTLLDIVVVVLCAAYAVSVFKYLMTKKSVNVYFSMGITRGSLFASKYLSGAFMLTSAVVIPTAADLVLNIAIFGNSKELWISAAYLTVSFLLMILYSYSITAMVCCCVGTAIEAGIFGVILTFLPSIAESFFTFLFKTLLYGSPYSENYYYGTFINSDVPYETKSLFEGVKNNLMFFSSGKLSDYAVLSRMDTEEKFYFENPSALPIAVVLAITVCFGVLAFVFHKRRKTEIAGFIGASPILTGICSFTVSMMIIDFVGSYMISVQNHKLVSFLLGAAIIFAVYAVAEFISLRSFKLFIKNLWKYPIQLAVFSVAVLIFASGLFGYSAKVPQVSEIKSVAVTTGTGDRFTYGDKSLNSGYYEFFIIDDVTADIALKTTSYETPMLVTDENIELVTEIHKMYIDIEHIETDYDAQRREFGKRTVECPVRIVYYLKDGSKFERMYNYATDEILAKLSELTLTEDYKECTVESIRAIASREDAIVSLASPNFTAFNSVPELCDPYKKLELFEAVIKDISEDRLPLNFNTASPVLGYVCLVPVDSFNGTYSEELKNLNTQLKIISQNDLILTVPVYESMTETVKFLSDNGCAGYFENAKEPVKVEVWDFGEGRSTVYSAGLKTTMLNGFWYDGKTNLDDYSLTGKSRPLGKTAVEITDKAQAKKYAESIRMVTLDCFSGKYVKLTYDDGSCTYGYAPDSVFNG